MILQPASEFEVTVQDLETAVAQLPPAELKHFAQWFEEYLDDTEVSEDTIEQIDLNLFSFLDLRCQSRRWLYHGVGHATSKRSTEAQTYQWSPNFTHIQATVVEL